MNKTLKRRAYFKGIASEFYAALYLMLKGYRIIAWRYKTKMGEIDVIARKGRALIAVEIKAHKTKQASLDAVTPKSQKRIIKAMEHFIAHHPDFQTYNIRFDVVAVYGGCFIHHLDNAFIQRT